MGRHVNPEKSQAFWDLVKSFYEENNRLPQPKEVGKEYNELNIPGDARYGRYHVAEILRGIKERCCLRREPITAFLNLEGGNQQKERK